MKHVIAATAVYTPKWSVHSDVVKVTWNSTVHFIRLLTMKVSSTNWNKVCSKQQTTYLYRMQNFTDFPYSVVMYKIACILLVTVCESVLHIADW